MNNVLLMSIMVCSMLVVAGCGKKHQAETSMDENAVVSENVVSVTETNAIVDPNAVPVVVENAAVAVDQTVEAAASGIGSDKPTPKNIQTALKNAGLYNGKIDGNIGPKTKKAVEAFQSQNGLKADGKVGPKTWKALSAHLGKTAEVANPTAEEQGVSLPQ